MSPKRTLHAVLERYPDLEKLPKAKLKLVEKAILYASNLAVEKSVLSNKEHQELLKTLGPKGGISPGNRLKAYRLRQELNQLALAKKKRDFSVQYFCDGAKPQTYRIKHRQKTN